MTIKRVTFSGIDDSTDPKWLVEVSHQFKDVIDIEWGILLSPKTNRPRYPSEEWVESLEKIAARKRLNLSGHLCGSYAKSFAYNDEVESIPIDLSMFDRIQINLAPFIETVNKELLIKSIKKDFCYIVQAGTNIDKSVDIANFISKHLANTNILFDCSGGRGISQETWPEPVQGFFCGYAGGIGVPNIEQVIEGVTEASGGVSVWIDMESGIRTNDITDHDKIIQILNTLSRKL